MRARAGPPALEIPLETRVELLRGGRCALVRKPGLWQAELMRSSSEWAREHRYQLSSCFRELFPERRHTRRPGLERISSRSADGDSSQRCVALTERGRIVTRESGPSGLQTRQHAIEVGAADRR